LIVVCACRCCCRIRCRRYPGTENTLGKESGHKKIVGIDSQDAVATDNETTESGKAATNDVIDKSDHESATTDKSETRGNKKRAAEENLQEKKGKNMKKTGRKK
jgi:hypothetical protein